MSCAATFLLIAVGSSVAGSNSAEPPALALLLGIDSAQAKARLSTAGAVIVHSVQPGMRFAVYGLGLGSNSTLFYDQEQDGVARPKIPPRPIEPAKFPSPRAKELWEKSVLEPWKRKQDELLAAWWRARQKPATEWARKAVYPVVGSSLRSAAPPSSPDVDLGLFNASQFFKHEGGTPILVVIVNEMPTPVAEASQSYDLTGVHVVLAGWETNAPADFKQRTKAWIRFFKAKNAAGDPKILNQGLDTTENIVKEVKKALGPNR